MSKDYANSFYSSKAWKSTQAAYMMSRHYICEDCSGVARIVHHVKHITPRNIGDPAVTLEWSNLKALCVDCHAAAHGSSRAVADGLMFDCNGDIIALP